MGIKENFFQVAAKLQAEVSATLISLDASVSFRSEDWKRSEGGGGKSDLFSGGERVERAGVNFSNVYGVVSEQMHSMLNLPTEVSEFEALGTSIIVHPRSPLVPTVHMNVRYFNCRTVSWFGGGIDLTPYYVFDEDVIFFHDGLKKICDSFDVSFYPKFKKWCDQYFFLPHRGEARGVGGIFFDYLGRDGNDSSRYFDFAQAVAVGFMPLYGEIFKRRCNLEWSEKQRAFQLFRRSRYVEFNLLYDRGTHFGLKSNGRIESIFSSMPPLAAWEYPYLIEPDSEENRLIEILKSPREWV